MRRRDQPVSRDRFVREEWLPDGTVILHCRCGGEFGSRPPHEAMYASNSGGTMERSATWMVRCGKCHQHFYTEEEIAVFDVMGDYGP